MFSSNVMGQQINLTHKENELSFSRVLKKSLLILKEQCHWLRAVSWEICGRCKLCPGKVDRETGKCFRHQKQGCSHDDCAHYVPVSCSPFCCKDARGPDLRIGRTWIQVCFKIRDRTFVDFAVPLLVGFWKSRSLLCECSATAFRS